MAYFNSLLSVYKLTTLEYKGVHIYSFVFVFLKHIPGLISIESPIFIIPYKTVPPTMPPFNYSILSPGLFMSNDLIIATYNYVSVSLFGTGN